MDFLEVPLNEQLVSAFVWYFESPNFTDQNARYCFNWFSLEQAVTLCRVLDYISQESDQVVALAMEKVAKFGEMKDLLR